MTDKVAMKLTVGILTICMLLTIVHVVYINYAYEHCSIIQFIARELW